MGTASRRGVGTRVGVGASRARRIHNRLRQQCVFFGKCDSTCSSGACIARFSRGRINKPQENKQTQRNAKQQIDNTTHRFARSLSCKVACFLRRRSQPDVNGNGTDESLSVACCCCCSPRHTPGTLSQSSSIEEHCSYS